MPSFRSAAFLLAALASIFTNCEPTNPTHPPIPTATFPPLPSIPSLPSTPLSCWSSYFSYSFTQRFLRSEIAKSSTRIVTTYSPPLSGTSTYTYNGAFNCSTTEYGRTTLCDGIPRLRSRVTNCITGPTTGTAEWTKYQSDLSTVVPTWVAGVANPRPTCTVAPDLSPLCASLFAAWSAGSAALNATSTRDERFEDAVPPCTPVTNTPGPTDKPVCRISFSAYSAYYWPSSASDDLCITTAPFPSPTPTTIPTPTTTTTVVSGHTLTSPTLYHFLHAVHISTYIGQAYSPGGFASDIWSLSTSFSTALTIAQLPSAILTAHVSCSGREADFCSMSVSSGFRVADLRTVRKEAYEKECAGCFGREGVLVQERYRPTVAVGVGDVQGQNRGVGEGCGWELWEGGWGDGPGTTYTSSSEAMVLVRGVEGGQFVAVETGRGGG
ncbi:hypothetical protein EJ04DRAFT_555655 [Polyplosphaeria fusca]|uniref:Uncharacterized protein n=1 Tax=Polyplosphaeria fusca TaxID=682080 RepID=A0A9P4QSJ0_9PLEO|nr:hypothetical protein EJ04DRAFT_555655 [Polyplosphaeria fusca]